MAGLYARIRISLLQKFRGKDEVIKLLSKEPGSSLLPLASWRISCLHTCISMLFLLSSLFLTALVLRFVVMYFGEK